MIITLLASLLLMAAYFLMLYGGVAFVQDKRFFSSAPKELLAVIPDKKERFPGAHVIGWGIEILAVLLMLGAVILAARDGAENGFGFVRFFVRFLFMLYALEIYDIFFFDWFLLCRSGFYARFYPEVKGITGPHLFGFNKRTHILHFLVYIPACAVIAWVCTLF